ncbi:MAG: hypothetical protein H0X46_07040 [Bacteroidetes bacterium]|nr:hypothetical protein [Bacteroidota bacterium]
MKIKLILLFAAVSTLFFSCKKDDNITPAAPPSPPAPTVYSDYSNLAVGNYWIYERFNIDSSGNATPQGIYDSCYVESDTVINGNTYYFYLQPSIFGSGMQNRLLRDSLHYIIDPYSKIWFSSESTSVLRIGSQIGMPTDTICTYTSKMEDLDSVVTFSSGAYTTDNFKTTYQMYPGYNAGGNVRYISHRYAENIGLVQETLPFFGSSPNYQERRLVRYGSN